MTQQTSLPATQTDALAAAYAELQEATAAEAAVEATFGQVVNGGFAERRQRAKLRPYTARTSRAIADFAAEWDAAFGR